MNGKAHVLVDTDLADEWCRSWPGDRGSLSPLPGEPEGLSTPAVSEEVRRAMAVLVHPTMATEVTAADGTAPTTWMVFASAEGEEAGVVVDAEDRLAVCRASWVRDEVARVHPVAARGTDPPRSGAALPAAAAWALAVLLDHQRQEFMLAARTAGTMELDVPSVPVEFEWITATLAALGQHFREAVSRLADPPLWSMTWLLVTLLSDASLPTTDTDVGDAVRRLDERGLVHAEGHGVVLAERWADIAGRLLVPERTVLLTTRRERDGTVDEDDLSGVVTSAASMAWVFDPDAPTTVRLHAGPAGLCDGVVRQATDGPGMVRDLLTVPAA
jgi:hypothetical protein